MIHRSLAILLLSVLTAAPLCAGDPGDQWFTDRHFDFTVMGTETSFSGQDRFMGIYDTQLKFSSATGVRAELSYARSRYFRFGLAVGMDRPSLSIKASPYYFSGAQVRVGTAQRLTTAFEFSVHPIRDERFDLYVGLGVEKTTYSVSEDGSLAALGLTDVSLHGSVRPAIRFGGLYIFTKHMALRGELRYASASGTSEVTLGAPFTTLPVRTSSTISHAAVHLGLGMTFRF